MNPLIIEYIGSELEVVQSSDKYLTGKKGIVIDETKNTFIIESHDKKRIVLPKGPCLFNIGGFSIPGKRICHRPEDRPKKLKNKKVF